MAEDGEILRQVWHGQLPVCFRLDDNDVNTLQRPEPFYVIKKFTN